MNYFFFLEASLFICLLGALISSLAKSQEKIRFITIYSSFFFRTLRLRLLPRILFWVSGLYHSLGI